MTIATLFNIDDTVWFMHNNKAISGEVKDICTCAASEIINYLILSEDEEVSISKPESQLFTTEEAVKGCDPI